MLEEIKQYSPQTRSDILRNAIAVTSRLVQHPFVLGRDDEFEEIPIQKSQLGEDADKLKSPIQVRKDQRIQDDLTCLIKDGRFGANQSEVIRSALVTYRNLILSYSAGWRCYQKSRNGPPVLLRILEDLRVPIVSSPPSAKQKWTTCVWPSKAIGHDVA